MNENIFVCNFYPFNGIIRYLLNVKQTQKDYQIMNSASSGAQQVPAETVFGTVPNNEVHSHVLTDLPVTKSGYLYIYVYPQLVGGLAPNLLVGK